MTSLETQDGEETHKKLYFVVPYFYFFLSHVLRIFFFHDVSHILVRVVNPVVIMLQIYTHHLIKSIHNHDVSASILHRRRLFTFKYWVQIFLSFLDFHFPCLTYYDNRGPAPSRKAPRGLSVNPGSHGNRSHLGQLSAAPGHTANKPFARRGHLPPSPKAPQWRGEICVMG